MSCHSFKQVHVRLTSLGNMKTTCVVPYTLRLSWWINFCIFCELAKFTCASMHRVLYYKNENHKTIMHQAFLGLLQNHYPWKKNSMYMICSFQSEQMCGKNTWFVYGTRQSMGHRWCTCTFYFHPHFLCRLLPFTPNNSEIRDENSVAKATSIIC